MDRPEKVREMLDSYNNNGYLNGSILVALNGNIIENKGFGFANIEHSIPNSKSTKYRIGSLSKAFTAFAIFQLHDRGKINISDTIGKYMDDFPG
ncbi:MAG: serine hydrolase, partial [Lachnospiraceae bacterium]